MEPSHSTPLTAFSQLLDWSGFQSLLARLPAGLETLAVHHGLICGDERGRLTGRLNSAAILIWLLLLWVTHGKSLAALAALLPSAFSVSVSASAIHQRFLRAGPFLSALLQSLLESLRTWSAESWAGYQIFVLDATVVTRPGSKGTDARLHLLLQLPSLMPQDFVLSDSKLGESLCNFQITQGALYLADRAYSTFNSITHVLNGKGDVLIRFNPNTLPIYRSRALIHVVHKRKRTSVRNHNNIKMVPDESTRIFIEEFLGQLKIEGECADHTIWLQKANCDPIQARLILIRLSPKSVEEQLKKVKREQGKAPSLQQCLHAQYMMLLTTVPRERLDKERIAQLYRLRWQIELEFKREKSIQGLDQLTALKPDSIRIWLQAHLLAQFLMRSMLTQATPPLHSETTEPDESANVIECPWNTTSLAWTILTSSLLRVKAEHVVAFITKAKAAFQRRSRRLKRISSVARFAYRLSEEIKIAA